MVLPDQVSGCQQLSWLSRKDECYQACMTDDMRVECAAQPQVEDVTGHACDNALLVIAALVVSDMEQEGGSSL